MKTLLSRIVRYYLACIGHEEFNVSVFAKSDYELDYSEMPNWETAQGADVSETPQAQELIQRLGRQRGKSLYVGYPVTLKFVQARSGWMGYFVEPFFLFPLEKPADGTELTIDTTSPVVNLETFKRLSNATNEGLMDELIQLENELGLIGSENVSKFYEVVQRLEEIRPQWPWTESLDLANLTTNPPLAQAEKEGFYNRAVLVVGDRPPYTRGLEAELTSLAKLPLSDHAHTALGQWLTGETPAENETEQPPSLMEVLPLNSEQRTAIQKSLRENLTVITGPPGTGKSQVVTDMLINAAWQGKKILFASKNNKAVDVVEVRINELGPRPILLRVGSNAYRRKLAEYLLSLLSTTATESDQHEFDESWEIQEHLEKDARACEKQLADTIDLRNRVDVLEREAESARARLPEETLDFIKIEDLAPIRKLAKNFSIAIRSATKSEQGFWAKLLWFWLKKERFEMLRHESKAFASAASMLGLKLPDDYVDNGNILEWFRLGKNLELQMQNVEIFNEYFAALRKLQASRSPEAIAREQAEIAAKQASNAESLWRGWLRLQPSKLSHSDRLALSQYRALLEMVIDTAPNTRLASDIFRRYTRLIPGVSHLLPCWAVTSLSARGMVPFEAGFFDIVVFDEASQCDIASALPLLYRAKQAVVIGDPKQLRHISRMNRGQDMHLLKKHDLADAHLNWSYSRSSLFDLATAMVESRNIVTLRDHHRSHADIISFSNQFFYENRLRVATRYDRLRKTDAGQLGVRWESVSGKISRPSTGGAENKEEAKKVVQVLKRLVIEQEYPGSIGVVSPFRAQANLITKLVNEYGELERKLIPADFLSDTVHKFQGDERDIMIFSPVLSAEMPRGALGFLKNNGNLFNVAITRARAMLIIVGDMQAAMQSDVEHYRDFAKYVQSLDGKQQIRREQGGKDAGPNYPTVANPELVSEWEKILYCALYRAGIRSVPQFPEEKYLLDLAVFDGDRKLNVEVDGERYHRDWTGELCQRDQMRNHRMVELGWDVLRFWVYEVRDDLNGCVERVARWVNAGAPSA